jgi:hypothetical protein
MIKRAFKELHQWASRWPVTACVFSVLTGILATWHGTRSSLDVYDLIPWILLVSAVGFTVWIDSLKLIATILTAALLLAPMNQKAAEKPAGGGVIVAVVVVVVAGVVIFKVVQFCENHFPRVDPPPTNNVPNLEASDFYAASTSYSALGSCYVPTPTSLTQVLTDSGTVFELEGGFDSSFNYRMTGCRKVESPEASVDLMEFSRELAPWGIHLGGGGETYYGLNGQPSGPDRVPIVFGPGPTVDVARGDWVQTVVWERSSDLLNWTPMLTMTISAEQRVRFGDCRQEGSCFYRCRPL